MEVRWGCPQADVLVKGQCDSVVTAEEADVYLGMRGGGGPSPLPHVPHHHPNIFRDKRHSTTRSQVCGR